MKPRMQFQEPANGVLYRLASFAKRIILLYRSLRLKQVEMEDALSGERFIYVGEGESLDYVRGTLLADAKEGRTTPLSLRLLRQTVKHLVSSNVPTLVEINRMLLPLIPAGGLLSFPWVRQEVSLNKHGHTEKKRKIEAYWERKVKKFDYRYQITRDKKMVQKFYEDLYLPYVTARFENACHARTLSELQAAARSGFLIQVFSQDLWISGVVCRLERDGICTFAFGHLPADQYDLRRGALSAAYYFVFKWAAEHSVQKIDFLRSRPNTSDGVYEHKRRWGANPAIDSWPHTALWLFLPEAEICPGLKAQLVCQNGEFTEIKRLNFGSKTVQK